MLMITFIEERLEFSYIIHNNKQERISQNSFITYLLLTLNTQIKTSLSLI